MDKMVNWHFGLKKTRRCCAHLNVLFTVKPPNFGFGNNAVLTGGLRVINGFGRVCSRITRIKKVEICSKFSLTSYEESKGVILM